MRLDPNFNPYGDTWFDTVNELAADVEHLSEKVSTSKGPQGHQGSRGFQGRQGATGGVETSMGLSVPALTDSLALNGTIYYSVDRNALVYKDAKGVVSKLGIVRE